jgi:hypothetical protein
VGVKTLHGVGDSIDIPWRSYGICKGNYIANTLSENAKGVDANPLCEYCAKEEHTAAPICGNEFG